MASKVAIVTDSVSCLTRELIEAYSIGIVPIMLLVQGKIYRDLLDITPSQAYEMFLQDPDSFTTSPSAPGHFLEAYEQASTLAETILCITLSSRLSTGYEMARVAREEAAEALPSTTIEVLDSLNVTAAEGFVVLAAARAAAEEMDLGQVIKAAEKVRDKVTFIALLDTLKYVYRTGRVPRIASRVGSMLNIKPILTISGGLVKFKGLAKNREHGISRILNELRERVGNQPVHVAVMHAYAPEEAERLKERIAAEFNCAELWITEFSPVMGYATGTGTLGFAYYAD